ncbi:hypothetical protein P4N68_05865 [Corynebacterium felinum]|uniref:Uncharacterized protein n=1 Tax=Corynebacterium felinum TaxID=131318 RepID=A0ABU2B6B1_9CORY|nr:hypothetical protein [Corynebacterium felinum]MDF5820604.1 hypothetical protein [Corynebacterium felinum]MDR7354159.1 hypothetical protein [Corynebacterium felinum]WJY96331.1 hypothetical protein CFELI_13800 [Corynebacterium felinum]
MLDHIGSAHTPEELALLKSQAQRLIDGDQLGLDFGVASGGTGGVDDPVPVIGQKAGDLLDAIRSAFVHLGLDAATGRDLSGHHYRQKSPDCSIESRNLTKMSQVWKKHVWSARTFSIHSV